MHVVGLDLSLRCSGVVRVPVSWGGDWQQVDYWLIQPTPLGAGATEAQRIQRCGVVSTCVLKHIEPSDRVFVERYAYRQAEGAHWLGELGGIVRLELLERLADFGALQAITASQARRLLCGDGNAPKQAVQAALRVAGAPAELTGSLDLCDAMAVANWGLKELGGAWLGSK